MLSILRSADPLYTDRFVSILSAFSDYLGVNGISRYGTVKFIDAAHHLLIWLDLNGHDMAAIDDALLCSFLRHDCRCHRRLKKPRASFRIGLRQFHTRVLRFVCFLEQSGRTTVPGDLDRNIELSDRFVKHLAEQGYSSRLVTEYRTIIRHFIVWLHQCRLPLTAVDERVTKRFRRHQCICSHAGVYQHPSVRFTGRQTAIGRVNKFLDFLIGEQLIADFRPQDEQDPVLDEFENWLRQYQGIGGRSVRRHVRNISKLLPDLGRDSRHYNATLIRDVLLKHLKDHSRTSVKRLASSLRAYLRFEVLNDRCKPELISVVPTIPQWSQASLPRHVPMATIEDVIDSCDTTTPIGIRDRAMVLLLARLALRAGDVVQLRLQDIDWDRATIRICGKSRREVELDLPQDVGDALLDYILKARPRVNEDQIFLSSCAPYRPLAPTSSLPARVRTILNRAGVTGEGLPASHLFRHSLATHLLRAGTSLDAISTLLRHHSHQSTAVYAKTDAVMLLEVAQPWIGGDDHAQ